MTADALRSLVEQKALDYHKAQGGEDEYGCPGLTCPGVQRLTMFGLACVDAVLRSCGALEGESFEVAKNYDSAKEWASLFHGIVKGDATPNQHEKALSFLRIWANSYLLNGRIWDIPQTMGAALNQVIHILEATPEGETMQGLRDVAQAVAARLGRADMWREAETVLRDYGKAGGSLPNTQIRQDVSPSGGAAFASLPAPDQLEATRRSTSPAPEGEPAQEKEA